MATIFFSHASRDDGLASRLLEWLRQQGFDDIFADHDSIRSGEKWTEALRRAAGSCRVVLSVVTPTWLGSSECFGEFTAGWYAGRRMISLICVGDATLDDLQKQRLSRVLLEDQGVDICRAGAPSGLDLDAHPEVGKPLVEGLRAAGALAKVGLDPSVFSIDDYRDQDGNLLKPPFPGLQSFGETDADAAIFYGRSSEIAQVLEDLRELRASGGDRLAYASTGRAYVIQGASGAGKSSLLKAGVLPRLRRERGWVILHSFRPGSEPLLHFAEALAKSNRGQGIQQAPGSIRDRLLQHWRAVTAETTAAETARSRPGAPKNLSLDQQRGDHGQLELPKLKQLRQQLDAEINPIKLASDRPAATALISLDQGEELVRAEGEAADALADYVKAALLQTSDSEPAPYAVVLTVRTDSFQELQTSARLEGLGTRIFDLRPLPIYRFAEAIEQPASRYGVEIEPQLVEVLMDDAGGKDALPLLAFTLQRLWRQYEAEKRIRKVNYDSVGKLLGLIEDAAERAIRGFDPGVQQGPLTRQVSKSRDASARRVFLPPLAQVNERGSPVRRVASWTSFDDEGQDILGSFEKWRLVTVSGAQVEVAHEALFRAWPRFLHWLEPEKARMETLRGLETAAASWDANGRMYDFITHTGRRLREAQALTKHEDFRTLIDRSGNVVDYLKMAKRLAFGWRVANWYSVVFVCLYVTLLFGGLTLAYATGSYAMFPFILGGAVIRFVLTPLNVSVAYFCAFLRQITLRKGFQSDILVFTLTLIASVASAALYYDFMIQGGMLAAVAEKIPLGDKNVAMAVGLIGDLFNFMILIPVFWMFLQVLMLATVPIRFGLKRFFKRPVVKLGRAA